MTRGDFALRLAGSLGLDTSSVDAAIRALQQRGITTADSVENFNASNTVTREQAAVMFARAFDISSAIPSTFTDVVDNKYYTAALAGLQDAGIFVGYADGTFGVGKEFDARHFDVIWGNLETAGFLDADSPGATIPGGATGTPAPVQADPSIPPSDDEPAQDDPNSWMWAETYLAETFDLPGMGAFVQYLGEKYGAGLTSQMVELELRTWENSQGVNPFHERFGAVIDGRAAANLNPMSPQQILLWESQAAQIMREAGMPPGFYDEQSDFHQMMIGDLSVVQLQERLANGFVRVAQAPLAIRQAFTDFYGVQGDEALAAFFIDPDRAAPLIEKQVTAAEIAGEAVQHGFAPDMAMAERLATQGVDRQLAFTGFARLAALDPVFEETVGETEDLDAMGEGIEAEFFADADAMAAMQGRVESRVAAFSGGGGAAATSEGIVGLGTSR